MAGRLWLALFACLFLTIGLGVAKVYIQKEHPPAWLAGKPWQFCEGFVSIDGHGAMAAGFRKWYSGGDPGARELRELFGNEMHPTAVVAPAAVGALDLAINFIPYSFMLLSAAALAMNAWLAARIAAEIAAGARDAAVAALAAPLAAIAAAAHCLTIRTSAQLLLDPFCAALASASILFTIRWLKSRDRKTAALLLLVQVLGIFTKISYAPMLAAPAVAAFFIITERRWRAAAAAAALFGFIPAALWAAGLYWISGLGSATRESQHLLGSWELRPEELLHFALEMALLFQGFAFLLLRRPVFGSGAARAATVAIALILAATWAYRLPAVPRLYLPVVAPIGAVCAVKLCDGPLARRLIPVIGAYLLLNYGVGVAGLWIGG